MTDITIPPAALEAGARAIAESLRTARLTLESEDGYKPEARAAFALLENWPGKSMGYAAYTPCIILPLIKENTDAEA